ncbi:Ig-like domain-containing protein [Marinobacter arenosus]|uniref:Ig-like domain-containing protein n=1 Tax=Marinobacter arenosus TaxID=2856822 RepID=UPI001C4D8C17|nr:Ig-like domain-containing protein [Marinobacter arenosus]MBW0149235.1 hypothetical protein [Marinobacter arenosus]
MTLPSGTHQYGTLTIGAGGKIKVSPYNETTEQGGRLTLDVNELVVAEGGVLSASGAGYGLAEGQPQYVGGSHGGRGGNYRSTSASLPTHGAIASPTSLGYGGRYGNVVRGGGALKIQASSVDLSGTITSAGGGQYYGSGAGGSIWLEVGTLTIGESGRIEAAGGFVDNSSDGGGGGGRIHVAYDNVAGNLETSVRAPGGGRYNDQRSGGSGTVLLEDRTAGTRILVIDNGSRRNGNATELTALPSDLDEIRIRNATVTLAVDVAPDLVLDNSTLSQASNLTVPTLVLQNTSTWEQSGYELTITDSYSFENSTFVQSGQWNRPEGVEGFKILNVGETRTFKTIQSAIDAANEGDVVLIDAGVYDEGVRLDKLVHLKGNSENPADVVIKKQGGSYSEPPHYSLAVAGGTIVYANEDVIVEGLSIAGNPSHDWHSAVRFPNHRGSVIFNKVRILSSRNHHTLYGLSTPGRVEFRNSYLERGYATFNRMNDGQIALNKVVAPAGISYWSSSVRAAPSDSITSAAEGYGPSYGEWLLNLSGNPNVASVSINSVTTELVNEFEVNFEVAIDRQTFDVDDITLTGPNGAVGISSVDAISGLDKKYLVVLDSTISQGTYQLTIGPDVLTVDGKAMNHDFDETGGEPEDAYRFQFEITVDQPDPLVLTSHSPGSDVLLDKRSILLTGTRGDEATAILVNGEEKLALGLGSWALELPLLEGANALELVAVNAGGISSDPISLSVDVDSIAPQVDGLDATGYLSEPPALLNLRTSDGGSGIDLSASSLELLRDGSTVEGVISENSTGIAFTPQATLTDGNYKLSARVTDARGNSSPSESTFHNFDFVVDTVAPSPVQLSDYPAVTSINVQSFTGTIESGAELLVNVEPIDATVDGNAWEYLVPLEVGENQIVFTQRDLAGNTSSPTVATIRYDDLSPGPVVISSEVEGDGKTIRLDWSAYDEVQNGNDIKQYQIFVEPAAFSTVDGKTPFANVTAGTKNHELVNLERNVRVHLAVVAQDQAGLRLNEVTSVALTPVDVIAPEDVSSLEVSSTATSLKLRWAPVSADDLAGYRVYIDKQGTVESQDLPADSVTLVDGGVEFLIEGLEPAASSPVRVTTYDQDGNESSGVTDSGITLLANPANLTPEPFSGKIELQWSAVEPFDLIKNYRIYLGTTDFTSVAGKQPAKVVAPSTLSTAIAGLQNGTTYHVAVTAVNLSGGESTEVSTVSVTPEDDLVGPNISRITYFDGTTETELADGTTLKRTGMIRVYADDPSGMSRVEVLAGTETVGTDYTAAPAYEIPWNLVAINDGQYSLTAKVFDTLSNESELTVNVEVALEPPAAPEFETPKDGAVTNQPVVRFSGQAEPTSKVRVSVNGSWLADEFVADAAGRFSGELDITEGENVLLAEAAYSNRGVYGDSSAALTVTLDSSVPDAPQGVNAQSKPLGQIALSWSAVENAAGYHVYRSSSEFTDPAMAERITTQMLQKTTFQDLPVDDGEYYYRVVSLNDLGTESDPSSVASAVADSVAPHAVEIRMTPQGSYDEGTGRIAPGQVDLEVVFNEPLKTTPYLAFTVSGGLPMVATLNRDYSDDTLYTGQFQIEPTNKSGTAIAVLSAHDEVGNRGTEVKDGQNFVVDTQGPAVAKLQINPGSPIKNEADASGLGQEVEVVLTLSDEVMPGELPQLVPVVIGEQGEEVINDYASGLVLTKNGASLPGAPVYTGRFRLPLSAGQNSSGETTAEILSFQYSARDDLGNESTKVPNDAEFQVYQGELPPLATPAGLTARALPGGRVELIWSDVEGASGYKLFRQAPGETELTELTELSYPDTMQYVDGSSVALTDGIYQYAIASLRSQNGEVAESALSQPVYVTADGTAPDAPENLSLELNGAGIVARWQPPASEAQDGLLKYNLYRVDLPEGSAPSSMEGYAPLQNGIPDIIALDSRPSATEHLYLVTAVDPAGNESAPSNGEYLNVDLLPVSDLSIALADQGRPALQWNHSKSSAVGFDVYRVDGSNAVKLNDSRLNARSFEDLDYNGGNLTSGAPADRLYRVVAVDDNNVSSVNHDLLMPALSVSLLTDDSGTVLDRGVMNRVMFRVVNAGASTVVQARLKATLMDNGTPREHWSERFTVEPGSFTDVPVVIGGYDQLPTLTDIDTQIVVQPKPGQSVTIEQRESVQIGQSGLVATVQAEEFVRGATGKVRLKLENPSDVETELLLATNNGKGDSSEVRLILKDGDGNVLSQQAVRQATGNVITVSNGATVARIPANGTFTSGVLEIAVPSSAPDNVTVHLEIDKFRYHTGRDTYVAIEGTRASSPVSLKETPYYGALGNISPATAFVGDTVEIAGQAIDRQAEAPLANVPLNLVLTTRGFERTFPVYTNSSGDFVYKFTPGASESGEYSVAVLHPSMVERPQHGTFVVEGAGVSPAKARLTIPRNYQYGLDIRVRSGYATQLSNVRLVYAPSTDSEGNTLPVPQGMSFDLGATKNIGENQTTYFKLKFSGDASAAENGTLRFHVLADNRAEPLGTVAVEYFLTEAQPILLPQPSIVDTGVGLGQSQQESITVKNTGLDSARNLSISLVNETGGAAPSWFRLLTPANLSALAVGEQTEIQIAAAPDASVPVGDYLFKVRITADNLEPMDVPVLVAATDSDTGEVFFHTVDIYTATLDENMEPIPGLGNVKIKLQNTEVLSEVYELTTDVDGFGELTDIPVGRYSFRASAFDHESVSGHLWVKAGVTTQEQIFLMNQLINVEFSVTEITLEDRYDIVLDATYETNVPAPVVLFEPMSVNLPMLKKGEVFQGEFTLTNHGLIEAYDVQTTLPTGDEYARFDYLTDIPDVLSPGQVVRVPYRIVALQDFEPSGDGTATGGGCLRRSYRAVSTYSAQCAVGSTIDGSATMLWNATSGDSCSGGSTGGLGGGYFGGGYYGGSGGGTNYSPAPSSIAVDEQFCPEDCETCCGGGSGGSGSGFGGSGGGFNPAPGLGTATGVPQGGFW